MRRSPVRRAWCDGMRWYPMPELPNHSGYNRDSRSFFADQNTQSNSQIETEKKPIETTKANIKKPELSRKDLMGTSKN
ncbi:hypothetical protein [Myxacorys almedinensis]|uniref:Uncharacterized protein n=1 Tax=Myxacorys almedinensis A TaxID=2690445 RepID=A0A8J7Z4L9_9CYAN|nr:hypothetical protein [Myxacorys almedinensis]NDJ19897.1 hypothetical protein [Myxacorys almedinensis A]